MPSLMLTYRAAAFWQRMYCPEISMGFLTKEEADDIQDVEYEEIKPKNKLADLASKAAVQKKWKNSNHTRLKKQRRIVNNPHKKPCYD